jgi:hypothetical protein
VTALPYVDVERILVGWLGDKLSCRVVTELPSNLEQVTPLLQIERNGGADTRPGLDFCVLDVDAFGANRATAADLAEKARWNLRFGLPGTQIEGAVFTACETLEAPSYRPYDNTDLRRFGATYQLVVHVVGA